MTCVHARSHRFYVAPLPGFLASMIINFIQLCTSLSDNGNFEIECQHLDVVRAFGENRVLGVEIYYGVQLQSLSAPPSFFLEKSGAQ